MVTLCQVCTSFKLTIDSFASQTTHVHNESGTGCTGSHDYRSKGGTDCNRQCDHSTSQPLTTRLFVDIKQAPKSCALCRLVCAGIEEQFPAWMHRAELKCELKLKRHRGHHDLEKNYKVLEVALNDGTPRRAVEKPTLNFLPMISSDQRYEGFFTGKKIKTGSIDMNEVNAWIQYCCQYHQGSCRMSATPSFKEIPLTFRVIDVEKDCLTSITGEEYTVLSYVWGKSTCEFKTTQRNLPT